MNVNTTMKLGQSTSLLNGYKADVCPAQPFYTSSKPALYEQDVIVENPDHDAKWSSPMISFHENVEDLLSAVQLIKLRVMSFEDKPSEGGAAAVWPAGALILAGLTPSGQRKALKDLSEQLGLDLATEQWSYALVQRSRKVGTATHPCYERGLFGNPDPSNITRPETLTALKSLEKLGKQSTNVSMSGANGYLRFYETFGSHFVSKVDVGDSIFQVFAFAETEYKKVVDVYTDRPNDLSGLAAQSFALFTTPRNDAGYGRTAAISNICIISKDPLMETSLKDGLWFDSTYAGTNSIFAPFLRSDAVNVNTLFKKVVAISVELASLGVFAEYYRMLIWRRIFKGAMYTKYVNGSGVAPHFSNNCPYDLKSVFKGSNLISSDGLLSTLATPTVNVWQELIELDMIKLQFPDLVKTFSVFASGIQIPSPNDNTAIDIPGTCTVTLIGHVISSGGSGPVPPNLRLQGSSFKEIESRLFCGEFYGGLQISSCEGGGDLCVVMNGLMFQESEGKVSVVRDVREPPTMNVLAEHLTDIQFALIVAESRLNFLLASPNLQCQSLQLVKRFLLWLAGVAGSHYQYQDSQLVALEARAMYLANVATNSQRTGLPVPYLRYEAYKDVVNNVQNVLLTASDQLKDYQNRVMVRKTEERAVDRDKALNENIIRSGKLLQDYISTQANYQQSMEHMFSSISKEKEKDMDSAIQQVDKWNISLVVQRTAVEEAIINYQDAVSDWQKQEIIKAAINIASNLFSLAFTMAAPEKSITALEILGQTVQKIQKLVQVFDAVIKTYKSIKALPSNPQQVVCALKDIGPNGLDMPSSLEWDEMNVNFDATLSTGPDIDAKISLSAAFAVLVLRGKMLLQAQKTVQEIAADLSSAQQRITLHDNQRRRLDDLKANLNAKPEELDVSKIDLIGLSGQLVFFERQMLMTLASTLVIQDRALQYEYLRPPTPINSFTMLDLQLAIFNQSQSINQGITAQPLPTHHNLPIIYEIHGVKPESIINGKHFTFHISCNNREFAPYNYVRVKSVTVEIGGITSTKSGKYYTELVFDGNPFFDRGFNTEMLTFQSTSRIYTGLHDVGSSSHVVPDEPVAEESKYAFIVTSGEDPFGGKVSSITPFTAWQVSLPKTVSNEDIQFDNSSRDVTVRLIFYIYAQLKETCISASERHLLSLLNLVRGEYAQAAHSSASKFKAKESKNIQPMKSEELITNATAPVMCAAPQSVKAYSSPINSTDVSVSDVLSMMSGKSVCAGWDVVFSMTVQQVNDQLLRQYNDRVRNPQFMRETGNIINERKTSEGVTTKTVFNFKFNAPRLQFLLNNSTSAQIFLPIQSGHYEYSILANNVWIPVSKADVKETEKSYIQGSLPLAVMPGSVTSQQNVVIRLNGGTFVAKDFEAGVSNPTLGLALTDYFMNLKDGYEVYNLGTLDLRGIALLKSMTPTDFKFNIHHTSSNRDLLQLFIATTGKLQSTTALYLQEPIPSKYQSSLIINSKIFFQDVLPISVGDGGLGLVLEATEPATNGNQDKSWSSKATAGSISTPFPESSVPSDIIFDNAVRVKNDKVVVNLTGMKFETGDKKSNWNPKMIYKIGEQSYPFMFVRKSQFGGHEEVSEHSLKACIDMNSSLPLNVIGSGQNQKVQISAISSSVNIKGNLEPPAGICESNDRELQKMFLENMRKYAPPKLSKAFNQPFDSISLFALKNLLFPARNVINMLEAFVPGDMVVFGNFT